MVAPRENNSQQQQVNGANGFNGAGDDDRRPPQPSTSDETAEEAPPSVQSLCLRGLALGPRMLRWLARRAGAQLLPFPALDAIYCTLTAVSRYTSAADAQAHQPQSEKWYMVKPISTFLRITTAGVHIVERYLDSRLPENQYLRNWLRSVCATLEVLEEDESGLPSSEVGPGQLPELEPSPSSSSSSLSADEEHTSEEEPTQPETPGDHSMYFSVEQQKEQQEVTEAVVKDEEKRGKTEETEEKSEETAEEGKAERPETAAEEAGGAAASSGPPRPQPQPQPQPEPQPEPQPQPQPPAAAPAECLVSAHEAEQAAMGTLRTPSTKPSSSQDFLAAERPSQPPPVPSRPARRPDKGALFLNLLRSKKD